jgi:hypothetical protein
MERFFLTGNSVEALHEFTKSYQKWSIANVPQTDRLHVDNVYKILAYWFHRNPRESFPFEVIPEFVETNFELPLTTDGLITFSGRPDAIVRSKNTGKIYIVDHKTTTRVTDAFDEKFTLDTQFSGYWWVCEQFGLDVAGVYINAIGLPRLSDSIRTCPLHKVPRRDCAVQHVDYQFLTFYRDKAEIDTWLQTITAIAEKYRYLLDTAKDLCYIDQINMQGRFYYNVCQSCPFMEFCASGRNLALADHLLTKYEKN